ncbi:hypothetical protein AB4Z17_11765 [Paenibacillus sp. TAF43_2]|uniref:hypothetical protein n=1 Tax=Paenibacillus sp. TAF43_2 TaxID=3233069 RepID=UPI003F99761F
MKAKLSVYFDYIEAELVPIWMILKFKQGGIDWSQDYIYVPVNLPFHRFMSEDFDDHIISLSITSTELVVSPERPTYVGIHLPTVKERINKLRGEKLAPQFLMDDIVQLLILVSDLEEILNMNYLSIFTWKI